MKLKGKIIIFLGAATALVITQALFAAENDTPIERYLVVSNQASPSQADPLAQIIQVKFPLSVKTLGDAMNYLLRFSGYKLVDESSLKSNIRDFLKLPLPETTRNIGPIKLEDALLTLSGDSIGMLIDPVHRLISFRLMPDYLPLYKAK